MGEDEPQRRDTERVTILGDLQGEIMVFAPVHIREISAGGASVETPFPLHLNSLHDLRLTLGGRSVVLKARIAHSRISDVDQDLVTYRTGIEFIEPSDRVRSVISEFLTTLKATRGGSPDDGLSVSR